MSIVGNPIHPPLGGNVIPGSPFPENGGLYVNVNDNLNVTSILVDAQGAAPNDLQAFNSGVFGNPTAEQIWAWEAKKLAEQLARCKALASNMQQTVNPARTTWHDGVVKLNSSLEQAYEDAKNMCNNVGNTISQHH